MHPISNRLFVGVDVGGTKVAVLVADAEGNELARAQMPTRLETPDKTLEGIIDTVHEALEHAQAGLKDVCAIGLGIPGRVDPDTGIVRMAVNLNFREIPAGAILSQTLGVPCFLENDVRMAALGLRHHPNFANCFHVGYLSIGTGIAAGIIIDGKLYRGVHGMAGEIGHIEFLAGGPRCVCGAYGCLEALTAGPAIERMYAEALQANSGGEKLLTAGQIYQKACDGDEAAKQIISQASHYLGRAMKMMIMSYDLDLIVLGGGVSRAGEAFLQPILHDIEIQRRESALAFEMLRPEMFQLLPHDFDAALWGGIALGKTGFGESYASINHFSQEVPAN